MECRVARGTEEDGEGRLQSPWRSSMDRLQGESIDATSPPDSDCSPSNLSAQRWLYTFNVLIQIFRRILVQFKHFNDSEIMFIVFYRI